MADIQDGAVFVHQAPEGHEDQVMHTGYDEVGEHTRALLAVEEDEETDYEEYTRKWYAFNQAAHKLMVDNILLQTLPSEEEILQADPAFFNKKSDTSHRSVIARWKQYQDRLDARITPDGEPLLFFKNKPEKLVAHTGQWREIVDSCHCPANGNHYALRGIQERMAKDWITDPQKHGIPGAYADARRQKCMFCRAAAEQEAAGVKRGAEEVIDGRPVKQTKRAARTKLQWNETLEMPLKDVIPYIESILLKYRVHLRLENRYPVKRPRPGWATTYICHRGGSKDQSYRPKGEEHKRYKSRRCECGFRVQVTVPTADSPAGPQPDGDDTAVVRTFLEHDNHDPYSLEEAKYLPTHPTALAFAEEELVKINDSSAVLERSMAVAGELFNVASDVDKAIYKFYITRSEITQMTQARSENIETLKATIKSLENELAQMKSIVRKIPPSVLKNFNTDLTAGLLKCQEVMASARAEQGAPQRALKSGLVDLIRYHLEGSRINAWRKKEVDVDLLPLPEGRRVAPPSKALTLQQYIRLDGQ
ncbi:hypothetical protein KFL_000570260 [Klebsormidium nitens]|uniref:Uncharacterized protein n=1 Tax=Klebsormidium nitens TaxID=105231 RepID=A0A0U9HR51_KLENI|nr:hypothetical protein KFL_000570260 [Klebsormidium nitens]|eukprot:GAQ80579.1 hypothetical protein KFL_000570260 [Klebsormidium nitens]